MTVARLGYLPARSVRHEDASLGEFSLDVTGGHRLSTSTKARAASTLSPQGERTSSVDCGCRAIVNNNNNNNNSRDPTIEILPECSEILPPRSYLVIPPRSYPWRTYLPEILPLRSYRRVLRDPTHAEILPSWRSYASSSRATAG